jgi:TonB family protein
MFPQPMSRSEFHSDDSLTDPARTLEEHLRAGFPLDLALDLVLNEIVVRAAKATHASAAALALVRGGDMVCRATTGNLAPDLGVPLNTRDGLSGACLETRQPQLSVDTEFDPRVDPAISRRLGIRSILIVPVFDNNNKNAQFTGVLEVFSTSPAAFSHNDQKVLEDFAEECARIRQVAIEFSQRKSDAVIALPEFVAPELITPDFSAVVPPPASRSAYEAWTLVLGGLAILATIAVSFLIGYRIGWLSPWLSSHRVASSNQIEPSIAARSNSGGSIKTGSTRSGGPKSTSKQGAKSVAPPTDNELVVYEKGKVIFRMKPALAEPESAIGNLAKPRSAKPDFTRPGSNPIVEASSTTKMAPTKIAATKVATTKSATTKPATTKISTTKSDASQSVWLSPTQSEPRVLSRTEPQYPPDALAAHRAGNVVLEVHVAEDGSVSNIRTLSGDPILAAAAAEAVRHWRYQPYRQHDHPAQFQTDVTLSFSLPN